MKKENEDGYEYCERLYRMITKDKKHTWGTIGVSENIIDACWQALSDSVEYKLLKFNNIGGKNG